MLHINTYIFHKFTILENVNNDNRRSGGTTQKRRMVDFFNCLPLSILIHLADIPKLKFCCRNSLFEKFSASYRIYQLEIR